MPRETLASLRAERNKAQQEVRDAEKRLRDLWDKLADEADNHGFCEEFDEIAERLGAPVKHYDVTVRIALVRGDEGIAQEKVENALDYQDVEYESRDSIKV